MRILAIDPGTTRSGWCILEDDTPADWGIDENANVLARLESTETERLDRIVIEEVASYGMRVGRDVFQTVHWSGRFFQACVEYGRVPYRVERKKVTLRLCNSRNSGDPEVRAEIIRRYGGKEVAIGSKYNPGKLYGVKEHVWAALALAIYVKETTC